MLPHPEIIEASEIGHVLLIDDGKMKLVVSGKGPGYLDCEVVVAGTIKDRKVRLVMRCGTFASYFAAQLIVYLRSLY